MDDAAPAEVSERSGVGGNVRSPVRRGDEPHSGEDEDDDDGHLQCHHECVRTSRFPHADVANGAHRRDDQHRREIYDRVRADQLVVIPLRERCVDPVCRQVNVDFRQKIGDVP